ncbi:hypothetical protein [Streptacidiphilus melanogenes]|uniref:hypothetical protein n=1 Tax=Streptacidiphilus melanogenes TaxID=411235 RepID=UPI001364DDBB|nr:hypothetical protein [Streptacidiphilus melanogenes]
MTQTLSKAQTAPEAGTTASPSAEVTRLPLLAACGCGSGCGCGCQSGGTCQCGGGCCSH